MTKECFGPLRVAIPALSEKGCLNYLDAVAGLGAEGVLIGTEADPAAFDGLLLPGGGDMDPARYHRENAGSKEIDPLLDDIQFAAAERFIRAGIPTLGICRGHQLLNVLFGGTLIQDLPQKEAHAREAGSDVDRVHAVTAAQDGWLEKLYGRHFRVNSSHHQGVDTAGTGLAVDAYSDDGVVEAMHHRSLPVWCVQWHPERMCFAHRREDTVDGSVLLRDFLLRCERRRFPG